EIEDAKIRKITQLWTKKPRGLNFNDTDALIIDLKTEDGRKIRETFYFCLKPDGSFNVGTISRDGSHLRRLKLANFLKHYGMTEDVKKYNIKEDVDQWKGREVMLTKSRGVFQDKPIIYVP
ncbi:MAG: hypothetical protein NWE87_06940, partial [Candidatus Bathyarchaeota archaeon]|nr:hypothetical protein [Candidatus Bathyarchaeota archaeon]